MSAEGYVINAFGKKDASQDFQQFQILRGQSGPDDVEFDIFFCGISQFDVQFCQDDLGNTNFPIVPGREMSGVVRWVGQNVQDFKLGDRVGVWGLWWTAACSVITAMPTENTPVNEATPWHLMSLPSMVISAQTLAIPMAASLSGYLFIRTL